jgi:hypothetical protein
MTDMKQTISDLVTRRGELVAAAQAMTTEFEQAAFDALVNDRYAAGEASLEHRSNALAAQNSSMIATRRAKPR